MTNKSLGTSADLLPDLKNIREIASLKPQDSLERTKVGHEEGYQSLLGRPTSSGSEEYYKIGDKIDGRYEVMAIHKGGMGVVYGTFDHDTNLPRAIKTLQRRFSANKKMMELFEKEALVWVSLEKHPFIVRAHWVQFFDYQPYIFTEYVFGREGMGRDLQSWLDNFRIALPVAASMALQIAQGMQHAVRKVPGLVHRDLKPANILVNDQGRPMITDFGLVYAAEANAGTPAYMAPEQWQSAELDVRTDIYAYGCILYEMFTGYCMFPANSISKLRDSHLESMPVKPRQINPDIPVELENLILKCLAKQKYARPQNWDEIVIDCANLFHMITGQQAVLDLNVKDLSLEELLQAGTSLGSLGKYQESLDLYDQILSKDPENAATWNNKGASLNHLMRYQEALIACEKSIQLDSRNIFAWNNKGDAFAGLARHNEALAAYEKAIVLDPDNAFAWEAKGSTLGFLKLYPEALTALDKALRLNPKRADAWYFKGIALESLMRHIDAEDAYSKTIQLNPDNAESWKRYGSLLAKLRRYEESLAAFEKTIRLNPADAVAWYDKGFVLGEQMRFSEAIVAYDQAIQLNPGDVDSWNNKGTALVQLMRYPEAHAAFDEAIKLNPIGPLSWNNKGLAFMNIGRYEEAIAAFEKSLQLDPEYTVAWNNKALTYLHLSRFEDALTAVDQALKLNPEYEDAWNNKGVALTQLMRPQEAIVAFNQAIKLNPNDEYALDNRLIALKQLNISKNIISDNSNSKIGIFQSLLSSLFRKPV